ncbi:MAG: Trm112 family protein [Methylibium sp.]|uniref:Trm112 family protein n=1 Tax=Methylibium sp. TaxID=2067992 RepID=UPI0018060AAD|nr:Trm112 family protein [Methylibium sp.]MBA3590010.1 Trm112 family protein [Methylibium sp.]MBA3624982.1 Trm112 family protein [Methylibium sp.]
MDTRLMALLVCPICKGPLTHEHGQHELHCAADRLAFPIRDGIPVMLEAEARALDDAPPPAGPLSAA